jgi:hypothetical protein
MADFMFNIDLKSFAIAARWSEFPAGADPLELARTSEDRLFPGAIFPVLDGQNALCWYGAAATGAEWRLLQPLLLAHVGRTITDFAGLPTHLDPAIPVESMLRSAGAYAVAKLAPSSANAQFAVRALNRLRRAIAMRPGGGSGPPVATPQLLARLEMCLAAGDRAGADEYVGTLRSELRLDTLNLHFLQVRILSAFRSWSELVNKEWFSELALVRKPSSVAKDMLEALWFVNLYEFVDDPPAIQARYCDQVQSIARPLLGQVSITDDGIIGRLRSLEGLAAPTKLPPGPLAQDLIEQATEAPSVQRVSVAREAMSALSTDDLAVIAGSGVSQRSLAEIDANNSYLPNNWADWLAKLGEPGFSNAAIVARDAISIWPVEAFKAKAQADSFADTLVEIGISNDLRRERLIESLPSLVNWVKADPGYPRGAMRELYVALLQLFSLLEGVGEADRHAATDLLDACLTLGVSTQAYRALLADFKPLIAPGAGDSSIYWIIELASMLLEHPTPDPSARLGLLNVALGSFQSMLRLLSRGQRAAYNRVAEGAQWPTLPEILEGDARVGLERLKGQSIAIYTLTESAARQAEAVLKAQEPSLTIALAHDHVASQRLSRLARDSDVFVMTAASAKHAATDCILANRGDGILLYAPGRGFSGIVRIVEEYALKGPALKNIH